MSIDTRRVINLANEMAQTEHGLRFEIRRGMSVNMATGQIRSCWQMEVWRTAELPSGRPGKGVLLIRMASDDGHGPADLLKQAAALYDQGDVTVS